MKPMSQERINWLRERNQVIDHTMVRLRNVINGGKMGMQTSQYQEAIRLLNIELTTNNAELAALLSLVAGADKYD
jgi:hypothetical protein